MNDVEDQFLLSPSRVIEDDWFGFRHTTQPPLVVANSCTHLSNRVIEVDLLVLESLEAEGLFTLHFFQPKLDECLSLFHLRNDLELKRIYTALGCFNLF